MLGLLEFALLGSGFEFINFLGVWFFGHWVLVCGFGSLECCLLSFGMVRFNHVWFLGCWVFGL